MLGQDRWATPTYKSEVLPLVPMYLVYTVSQPKILSHSLLPFGVTGRENNVRNSAVPFYDYV